MAKILSESAVLAVEARFLEGEAVTLGEYRFTDNAPFSWMDKETGERKSMTSVKHTVEIGKKSILLVDSSVENEQAAAVFKSPYKKGDLVLVVFRTMGYVKGKGEVYKGLLMPLK